MPFAATWMDLEITILNQVSLKQNTIWYHLYVESKIWHKWIYPRNRNRLTDRDRLVVAKGEGVGEWWIGSLRLADANYIDIQHSIYSIYIYYMDTIWINNKVLLYSIGNYIQYFIINHNGKEYEREYIYV